MLKPQTTWLIAAGLALAPVRATAEPETHTYPSCDRVPMEAEVAAAKRAFEAGEAAFKEAAYARAISYWEEAYRHDCTAHALLLNLARAYELDAQRRQAVLALEAYLLRNPQTGERESIERRIEVLNAAIAAEEKLASAAPAPVVVPEAEPKAAAPPAFPEAVVPSSLPASEPPPQVIIYGSRPVLPLIVAGVGGAVAITGGVLYIAARRDLNEAEDACPAGQCPNEDAADEGDSANTRVNVTGAIALGGLGLAAGGFIAYLVSKPTRAVQNAAEVTTKGSRLRLAPAVAPNFAGLSLSSAF